MSERTLLATEPRSRRNGVQLPGSIRNDFVVLTPTGKKRSKENDKIETNKQTKGTTTSTKKKQAVYAEDVREPTSDKEEEHIALDTPAKGKKQKLKRKANTQDNEEEEEETAGGNCNADKVEEDDTEKHTQEPAAKKKNNKEKGKKATAKPVTHIPLPSPTGEDVAQFEQSITAYPLLTSVPSPATKNLQKIHASPKEKRKRTAVEEEYESEKEEKVVKKDNGSKTVIPPEIKLQSGKEERKLKRSNYHNMLDKLSAKAELLTGFKEEEKSDVFDTDDADSATRAYAIMTTDDLTYIETDIIEKAMLATYDYGQTFMHSHNKKMLRKLCKMPKLSHVHPVVIKIRAQAFFNPA